MIAITTKITESQNVHADGVCNAMIFLPSNDQHNSQKNYNFFRAFKNPFESRKDCFSPLGLTENIVRGAIALRKKSAVGSSYLQARRIDHVVAHAPGFEQAVKPEAVIASVVA